jgi:acetyl-CoA acetyltransferase family protein
MREAVIVAAVRSPVGKLRGGLSNIAPHELATIVVKEAVKRSKVDPAKIDEVMFGDVMGKDYNNIARVVELNAGIPLEVPGVTIDRQCGTSLTEVAYAGALIEQGMYDCVLAGGVEMDTRKPWVLNRIDQAYQMQNPTFSTYITTSDEYGNPSMVDTAENVAEQYKVSRHDCDAFASESHRRALEAWNKGYFDEQTVPIPVPQHKGDPIIVKKDEIMRESSVESLGKLRLASKRPNGVVTAGNSSPNCDGASAVMIMERKMAESLGCDILGIPRNFAAVGVDPTIMGIGPVFAIQKLMKRTGMDINKDIDLIEINEAFATQIVASINVLGLDPAKLNVNGGAIALGHPLAATGGILTAKMVYELRRRGLRYGVIAFCVGGGMGVAMLVENVKNAKK